MTNKIVTDYVSSRYIQDIDVNIVNCYLCNKPLNEKGTPDHIIPNHLFGEGDPERPKLKVHHECNNSKSKEDEWFVKHLQLRSSFNPDAEAELSKMIYKGMVEKSDAYIIGKKLHNYKLITAMFNKVIWGLELTHKGQKLQQMLVPKEDVVRFNKYLETMCRGLFIRNVQLSNPPIPKMILAQYAYLDLKNNEMPFINTIKNLLDASKSSTFGQQWGNRILYVGSRVTESADKGFVFIQFYSQFGVLATFN